MALYWLFVLFSFCLSYAMEKVEFSDLSESETHEKMRKFIEQEKKIRIETPIFDGQAIFIPIPVIIKKFTSDTFFGGKEGILEKLINNTISVDDTEKFTQAIESINLQRIPTLSMTPSISDRYPCDFCIIDNNGDKKNILHRSTSPANYKIFTSADQKLIWSINSFWINKHLKISRDISSTNCLQSVQFDKDTYRAQSIELPSEYSNSNIGSIIQHPTKWNDFYIVYRKKSVTHRINYIIRITIDDTKKILSHSIIAENKENKPGLIQTIMPHDSRGISIINLMPNDACYISDSDAFTSGKLPTIKLSLGEGQSRLYHLKDKHGNDDSWREYFLRDWLLWILVKNNLLRKLLFTGTQQ